MKAPPFDFGVGVELRYNGKLLVIDSVDERASTAVLRCPLRETRLTLSLRELVNLRMTGSIRPIAAIVTSDQEVCRPRLGELSKEDRRRVGRRMSYGRAASKLYPVGFNSPRLRELIRETAERIKDTKPPSVHSVYRWMRRYVTAGYDTATFMQDTKVVRTRAPKVDPRAKELLHGHIESLLKSYTEATLHGVTDLALALTARDLGYDQFVSKDGTNHLVDDFEPTAREQLRNPARPRRPRAKAKPPSRSTRKSPPTPTGTPQ